MCVFIGPQNFIRDLEICQEFNMDITDVNIGDPAILFFDQVDFLVFLGIQCGIDRVRFEPTSSCAQGGHANHCATKACP